MFFYLSTSWLLVNCSGKKNWSIQKIYLLKTIWLYHLIWLVNNCRNQRIVFGLFKLREFESHCILHNTWILVWSLALKWKKPLNLFWIRNEFKFLITFNRKKVLILQERYMKNIWCPKWQHTICLFPSLPLQYAMLSTIGPNSFLSRI